MKIIYITALPESLPHTVTAACLGEAERTFVQLLTAYLEDKFNSDNFKKIPEIIFWHKKTLKQTEASQPIADLNLLPMPARDLMSIHPHTHMLISRGYPYRCTFCASSRFWDKLRFFSADYVVDEIDSLR